MSIVDLVQLVLFAVVVDDDGDVYFWTISVAQWLLQPYSLGSVSLKAA